MIVEIHFRHPVIRCQGKRDILRFREIDGKDCISHANRRFSNHSLKYMEMVYTMGRFQEPLIEAERHIYMLRFTSRI